MQGKEFPMGGIVRFRLFGAVRVEQRQKAKGKTNLSR